MKKIITTIILCFVLALLGFTQSVFAASDLDVNFQSTPLFTGSDGPWYPTKTVSKWMDATNNSSSSQNIGFSGVKTGNGTLDQIMLVQIIKDSLGGEVAYGASTKHLSDLFSEGEVQIDNLTAGQSRRYYLKVTMEDAGNEYQDLGFGADFTIGFLEGEGEDVPSPLPGDGGVTSLFRGISENISSFFASVLGTTTEEPKEVKEEKLGEKEEDGEVKAEETEAPKEEKICFWWWVLLLVQIIILAVYYFSLHKNDIRIRRWWLIPAVISVLIFILHWFLTKPYVQTIYCDWYLILVLIVLIGISDIYLYFRNRSED